MGERQARLPIGHERAHDIGHASEPFAHERFAVPADGERDRVHAMNMNDDGRRE